MTAATLTLIIPDAWWLSSNQRLHWADKAKRTRNIRAYTALKARNDHVPTYETAHVTAWIEYPTNGRADVANSAPTVKAAIDGLVDAGVLPDDDTRHLLGPDFRRTPGRAPKHTHTIRLVITNQEAPF